MAVLRLVGSPQTGSAGSHHNGRNEAFFAAEAYGMTLGADVAAITLITSGGYPERNTEADVIFNSAHRWDSYRGPRQTVNGSALLDFRRVAVHEFGHIVGLSHPQDGTPAIMNASLSDLEKPAADDIAGVDFLYGIGTAPKFLELPQLNAIPSAKTDLQFAARVSGTPPFRYEIFRDGGLLRSEHAADGSPTDWLQFILRFETPAYFGTYRIDLINRVGRTSSREFVFETDAEVKAPAFVREPQSTLLAYGEPATLGAIVSGKPAPTFRWFKDGKLLPDRTGSACHLLGTYEEEGTYEVEASNDGGVIRSRPAKVGVMKLPYAPPVWTTVLPERPPIMVMAMAYGHGRFVAVGYSGALLSSADGIRWTRHSLDSNVNLECVAFGGGRFVAAGGYDFATGRTPFFVSYDGIGWIKAETDPLYAVINGVAFGDGRFVAVDLYRRTLVSTDGLQWRLSPWRAPGDDYLDAITYGNGTFVITGRKDRVWTSTDGLAWTERRTGVTTGINSVAFGNGLFVGVGSTNLPPFDKAAVAISPDGASWTVRQVQSVRSRATIRFLNDRFHLLGINSDHLLSADGVTWVQRNFASGSATAVAFGDGTYAALGFGHESYLSKDGERWTATNQNQDGSMRCVAWANDRFVLLDRALFSRDGFTWEPMRFAGYDFQSVAYGNSAWVAVGRQIARSLDGVTWTQMLPDAGAEFVSVAYGSGRFVAAGFDTWSSTSRIATSSEGLHWAAPTTVSSKRLRGITSGALGFVAVGEKGTILHSVDGTNWQARLAGTEKELHSVIWHSGRYIAVGGDGYGGLTVVNPGEPIKPNATVCSSLDGVTWRAMTLPYMEPLCSVAALDDLIVAGGVGGLTLYSKDQGTTWQKGPRAPNDLWRLAARQDVFLGACDRGLFRIPKSAFKSETSFADPPAVSVLGTSTIISFDVAGQAVTTAKLYYQDALIASAAGPSWAISNTSVVPGVYFAQLGRNPRRTPLVVAPGGNVLSSGDVTLVKSDIRHSNGNLYDQYLLTGPSAQLRARSGIITRVSFRDMSEDIVQVEFSGSGVLTVRLDNASAPEKAPNYNQAVNYVKGHPRIFISDADETTNVSVFTVGRMTAVDPSLFKDDVNYDGVADIGLLAIHSRNGRCGGVRLGNASIWHRSDTTGFWAPDTTFVGPIVIGDVAGFDRSLAGLMVRGASSVTIAGGDLRQPNDQSIAVDGTPKLSFTAGTDSHGRELPAQRNAATFGKDGVDVTSQLVPPL